MTESSNSADVAKLVQRAADRMKIAGLPEVVVKNFDHLFRAVLSGSTGVIGEHEIEAVGPVDTLEELPEVSVSDPQVRRLLESLVVIRLNGGLGTTMGLARAKSLLPVKGSLTFNDIIAQQLLSLSKRTGLTVPLMHMTSFATDGDITSVMSRYPELLLPNLRSTFVQHRHPKIYADTLTPAEESDDELNWNPPGHGDIYASLMANGLAERLLALGKRYLFVANADNLGATVDPRILRYIADTKTPFLMETAVRTAADSKGGHLARKRGADVLVLRESGQCPLTAAGELIPEFGDVSRYQHFNTNNIWLDLEAVVSVAKEHGGYIPLPLISNRKTVNPRDRSSRKVVQIETAMGAAIGVFPGARALSVPRSRFAPVKSNNDLLLVRSDVYCLGEAGELHIDPRREQIGLPKIDLDLHFFGLIADFERRFLVVPSLREASMFRVQGDVTFSSPVSVQGKVTLRAPAGKSVTLPTHLSVLEDTELELC